MNRINSLTQYLASHVNAFRIGLSLFAGLFLLLLVVLMCQQSRSRPRRTHAKPVITAEHWVEHLEQALLPNVMVTPTPPPRAPQPEGKHQAAWDQALQAGLNADIRVFHRTPSPHGSSTRAPTPPAVPSSQAPSLLVGSLIPAATITEISSDLPGMVLGQITQDVTVEDTLLIPQGSKIMGQYDAKVRLNQHRLPVEWKQLILPNRRVIVLDGVRSVDLTGQSGLHDQVDHHLPSKLGGSLLMAGLSMGRDALIPAPAHALSSMSQQIGHLGSEYTAPWLHRPPTMVIQAGYAFHLLLTKNLVIDP